MKSLSPWRSQKANVASRKAAAKRAKPLDRAAIRMQAISHLMESRGMTEKQARDHYDLRQAVSTK